MKINKQDKEIIIENSSPVKKVKGSKVTLTWTGGLKSYNIDMAAIWTKKQQEYLDQMEDRLNKKIEDTKKEIIEYVDKRFDALIEILARNGIK